ncbi:MAG TPA: hypothetical protein VFK05_12390 [Polyangiaceae bacterium]|nr:hypothetical protein [Polyangiaceae bacterium]
MTRTLGPWLSGIAIGLFWVNAAIAEPSAADRATARSLASEGYWALHDKRYAEAADRFSRADALVHAPTLTLDWARSLVGLGQFVEAQERYELILREGVDAKAPPSWQRALSDAKAELAALRPRLSWVTISVAGGNDAQVSVDGVAVPPAAVGVARAINPGAHEFAASAKGYLSNRQTVSLAEGEEKSVALELQVDPNQQATPTEVSPKPAQAAAEPPARQHNRTPAYVAFGVAGAGLVVGGVTGILALNKRSKLEHCNTPEFPDVCPPEYSDTLDAYHTLGIASGAGFIVGAAGIITGVSLWLLDNKSAAPARGLVVRPYVGLGSVGAVGRF